MSFAAGTFSFRRFVVLGDAAKMPEQEHLDRFAEFKLEVGEFSVPDETEYGWSGGRHVLDNKFSFEHNVFNDCINAALRLDTNKVPGEIKKAYEIMEEETAAAGNPSGFISKQQKRDVKDIVRRRVDEELRSGKFRRSKLVPILWDFSRKELYSPAGIKPQEFLLELFERSFSFQLQPLSSGSLALRLMEPKGRRRDYEDCKPTRFVYGPDGESVWPDYPWVAKGPEPKDFLGNEFALWLWHASQVRDGVITTESGDITVFIDKVLDLDCAYSQTGKDTLRGTAPNRMPEARDALRTGKMPRKAGMILHAGGQQYEFKINFETLELGTTKLPEVEEADTPRVLFEERVTVLRDLVGYVEALYATFLDVRLSGSWEGEVSQIRKWILKPVASGQLSVAS